MTRYLSDNWTPIIEADVDGPNALPQRIDGEVANLGKFSATRRVARTVYLGSAPTTSVANRGIEDRRIKLGCAMPGETPAIFGDALRRLSTQATFLYQDGPRYWYSTQPTVTKLAEDRADQFRRDPAPVVAEIEQRLRADLRTAGDFQRIHTVPQSGADIPDDMEARLVVLGTDHPHSSGSNSKAQAAATAILENRGNTPRLFRNTLVFLAVDQTRLQDLDEAIRRWLAWSSILQDKETLNLDPHQVRQAEAQLKSEDGAVVGRLPEAYQWLLAPVQSTPQAAVEWQALRLTGQDPLAVRASKKLRSEELLVPVLAGTRLRLELDRVPLWRGNHVEIRQLADHFARYLYLPRLAGPEILIRAIQDGLGLLLWTDESFAYADAFDEATSRYRGLRCGREVPLLDPASDGLLVKPEVAIAQQNAEPAAAATGAGVAETVPTGSAGSHAAEGTSPGPTPTPPEQKARRFHGAVSLDATRVGRDASQIADEVIAHLAAWWEQK